MLKDLVETKIIKAIEIAISKGQMGELKDCPDSVLVELPKNPEHGDRAISIAMKLTKEAKIPPRSIAEAITKYIDRSGLTEVEIAGPGFINLKFDWNTFEETVAEINSKQENFAQLNERNKPEPDVKSVLLEYVSANPTGDLHLGHGRQAVLGSALANLFKKAGYKVHNEFYINDAGAQIEKLGKSCKEAILINEGLMDKSAYDEENNYPLDSILEFITKDYYQNKIGVDYKAISEYEYAQLAKQRFLDAQKDILEKAKVPFEKWYSEKDSLHINGKVEAACQRLLEKAKAYQEDGALWFKAKEFGDERDRVLKKQDGKFTYLAADLAYHQDKLSRGFDRLINLWGADHHGQIAGMKGILEAAGEDSSKLEIVLMQMVSLTKNGQEVKMSKRAGDVVTITDLIAEVGLDAFRYFLVESQANNRIVFDLELAKKQDKDNPVYYIQYAHARCASIIRNISEERMNTETQKLEPALVDKKLLAQWQEDFKSSKNLFALNFQGLSEVEEKSTKQLILFLAQYPDLIYEAALNRAPNKIAHYLKELASIFHQFYTHNRVISDNQELVKSRLSIVSATKTILKDGLDILAISAPEKM
jgi:arginyl-tRNA synthetase